MATDLLIAGLVAGAILDLLTLHSVTAATRWVLNALALAGMVCAVLALVEYHRGVLGAAMQRLVLVTLAATGILYYISLFMTGFGGNGQVIPVQSSAMLMLPRFILLREISDGLSLLFASIGVAIILRSGGAHPRGPDVIES